MNKKTKPKLNYTREIFLISYLQVKGKNTRIYISIQMTITLHLIF
jgi:hypothetical protein